MAAPGTSTISAAAPHYPCTIRGAVSFTRGTLVSRVVVLGTKKVHSIPSRKGKIIHLHSQSNTSIFCDEHFLNNAHVSTTLLILSDINSSEAALSAKGCSEVSVTSGTIKMQHSISFLSRQRWNDEHFGRDANSFYVTPTVLEVTEISEHSLLCDTERRLDKVDT